MSKILRYTTLVISIIALMVWYFYPKLYPGNIDPALQTQIITKEITTQDVYADFALSSTAFESNGNIPVRHTCDGEGVSPELIFSGIPINTKSLALTMIDYDVPTSIRADGIWDHWVVWNMPSTVLRMSEGRIPIGVSGAGSSGAIEYQGPCPPDGEHRYVFTLYAIDTLIPISIASTKEKFLNAITGHIIAKTELIGRYNRNK